MSYTDERALVRVQAAGSVLAANLNADREVLAVLIGQPQVYGVACTKSDATGYGANSVTQFVFTLPTPENATSGTAYAEGDVFLVATTNFVWRVKHTLASAKQNALCLNDITQCLTRDGSTISDYSALTIADLRIWREARAAMPVESEIVHEWILPIAPGLWQTVDFYFAWWRKTENFRILDIQPVLNAASDVNLIFTITNGTATATCTIAAGDVHPAPTAINTDFIKAGFTYQILQVKGTGASPASPVSGGVVIRYKVIA